MAVLRFSSIKYLIGIKDEQRLATVLSSTSCLSIFAQSTTVEDVLDLVDFTSKIRVINKYLIIQSSPLNTTLLQTKKINFNVMINEINSGTVKTNLTKCYIHTKY